MSSRWRRRSKHPTPPPVCVSKPLGGGRDLPAGLSVMFASGAFATPGGATGTWNGTASAAWPAGPISWHWECPNSVIGCQVSAIWMPGFGQWQVQVLLQAFTGEAIQFDTVGPANFPTRPFDTGEMALVPLFPTTGSGVTRARING